MAGLSDQIQALVGNSSAGALNSSGGAYSPTWNDGSFAIAGPQFGSNTFLSGATTSVSGMDPAQLQQMLEYIDATGGYNQQVIGDNYNQAISQLGGTGAADIQKAALERMGLLQGLNVGGQQLSPEQINQMMMNTPGYQFQFQQGQRAVESSGASRGLLNSGAILKSLTNYGQGLASTNFGNTFGQLATLAGASGSTAGQVASLQASRGKDMATAAADASNQYAQAISQGGNKATVSNQYSVAPAGMEWRAQLGLTGAWR